MFENMNSTAQSKAELYRDLFHQATHLLAGESNEMANLSNLSALLHAQLPDLNWVGFYLWYEEEQQLILGPFQGKPACIRIDWGRGVCGTAVSERRTMIVPDVHAFPGHIACDADSLSEIVLPMQKEGRVLGVLDVDSPRLNRFTVEDAEGLGRIVEILVNGTQFSRR